MKKLILSTIFVGTFTFFANAGVYYVQFDFCGNYHENCTTRVLKCRETGGKFCEAAIQLPCEEACGIPIPTIE